MPTCDEEHKAAESEPADEAPAARHPNAAAILEKFRRLERRAVHLPLVGKLHAPDTHDVVYLGGMTALITLGIVELPIALVLLGGHALVKQHHSRSLAAIGEVVEEALVH